MEAFKTTYTRRIALLDELQKVEKKLWEVLAKCKQRFLPEELSEDEVLNYIIKNKSLIMNILTPYEQERVSACIL